MLQHPLQKFRIDGTPVGVLAQEYVERYWPLNPAAATYAGVKGYDHILDDYSYDGTAQRTLDEEFLTRLATTPIGSEAERLAVEVFEHDLRNAIQADENGFGYRAWGVVTSPASEIQELIALMERDTTDSRANIIARIEQIPRALRQWRESLLAAHADGHANSRHATLETIKQFAKIAEEGNYAEAVTNLEEGLDSFIGARADEAHAETASFLVETYLPLTRDQIGVGEEAYSFEAAGYTGTSIELRAAYADACAEIEEIKAEMRELGRMIFPDARSIEEVTTRLDNDPRYKVSSRDELVERIRRIVDDATKALSDEFTIPDEIRHCEVKLDDESMDASPYYIGPSDDLSRPGAMYYPTLGNDEFCIWRNVSTIYHEGIPGHHLQVAVAAIQRDSLTAYQRLLSWNSGYGEGWALYAERLMDELGYFKDPAFRLSHLIDRALRVARVVVDIGLHLELEPPFAGDWSFESAVEYFTKCTLLPREYVTSEINRYIAWPGQAISYKVGESRWLDARRTAIDSGMSVAEFHEAMLVTGAIPLDVFDRYVERVVAKTRSRA